MAGKFCVSITNAKNDADRATVAFVVANAAVGSGQETMVFLSIEGVRLAVQGYADEIHEEGFAPLKDLMANFVEGGRHDLGLLAVLQEARARREQAGAGATIVGGAKLVEFLSAGAPCVSY